MLPHVWTTPTFCVATIRVYGYYNRMKMRGRVGTLKDADKVKAKRAFFVDRGELVDGELIAFCQSCGRELGQGSCDFSHKVPAGRGGDVGRRVQPENGIASCRACHRWLETGPDAAEARAFLISSTANLTNGEIVQWPPELLGSLRAYLRSAR